MDTDELLDIARRAAALAGEVIMPLYASGFSVERKADRTLVTEADRRAETEMRAFLERECPGHGILGEEHGETEGDGRHRWILDPIDGTNSFVHRVPLFGTLVAFERDGAPIIGVIACHAAGETVFAAEGRGAWLGDQRLRVSDTARVSESVVTTSGLGYHPEGAIERVIASARSVKTWGDCYGYLMVAAGRAEAMLDPAMSYWDVAALYPIITEAGGRITTYDGEPGPGASSIASNGHIHDELLAVLRGG